MARSVQRKDKKGKGKKQQKPKLKPTLSSLLRQRSFPSLISHLSTLLRDFRLAVFTAQQRLALDDNLQSWETDDVKRLIALAGEEVLEEGGRRFVALEVGWRRLVRFPFLLL